MMHISLPTEKNPSHLICCKTGSKVCGKTRNIVKLHVFFGRFTVA